MNGESEKWAASIYQEVDGFYYYWPCMGAYSSNSLREIADKLDEMNEPWARIIENELNKN